MADRYPLSPAMIYTHRPVGQAGRCILCGSLTMRHGVWWERALYRLRGGPR